MKHEPPFVPGLPLLGNVVGFMTDPLKFLQDAHRKFGPVFSIKLGPKRATMLLGPKYNELFFAETDHSLSIRDAYEAMVPIFGRVVFSADPPSYAAQRHALKPAFSASKMGDYLISMQDEVDRSIFNFESDGVFDLVDFASNIAFNVGIRCFLGTDLRGHASEMRGHYRDLAKSIDLLMPQWLPLPKFKKRDIAKVKMRALIEPLLLSRRKLENPPDDPLQRFASAKDAEGNLLDLSTAVSLVMALVHAAYDTTAAHLCWTLIQLLQNPKHMRRTQLEIDEYAEDEKPYSLQSLVEMKRLDWAIKETERTKTGVMWLGRVNTKPLEVDGYTLPMGWMTMISPAFTHLMPEHFPNPEVYDPERFSLERNEERNCKLVAFGGGKHSCWGKNFAFAEIKIVLAKLLNQFELELVEPTPKIDTKQFVRPPVGPCMLRYKRRKAKKIRQTPNVIHAGADMCPFSAAPPQNSDLEHHPIASALGQVTRYGQR